MPEYPLSPWIDVEIRAWDVILRDIGNGVTFWLTGEELEELARLLQLRKEGAL